MGDTAADAADLKQRLEQALRDKYRKAVVGRAVVFAWDAETATGLPPTSNEHVAGLVAQHPDFFIGFACVDPWKGKRAVADLEHAVRNLGLRGLKLHPIAQEFFPSEALAADFPQLTIIGAAPGLPLGGRDPGGERPPRAQAIGAPGPSCGL